MRYIAPFLALILCGCQKDGAAPVTGVRPTQDAPIDEAPPKNEKVAEPTTTATLTPEETSSEPEKERASKPSEAQPAPTEAEANCSTAKPESPCEQEAAICPWQGQCGPCSPCEYLECLDGEWGIIAEDPDFEGNNCNKR